MPTELPALRPERDPRGDENLAATAAVLAIITVCLWLIYALADANAAAATRRHFSDWALLPQPGSSDRGLSPLVGDGPTQDRGVAADEHKKSNFNRY
jgi:hypothetical protein